MSEVRKELPDLKTPEFVPDKVRLIETRVRPGDSGVLLIYQGERKPDVPTPRIEIEQFFSPPNDRTVRIEAPSGGYEKVAVNGSDGYFVHGMPVVMTKMDGTRKIVIGRVAGRRGPAPDVLQGRSLHPVLCVPGCRLDE